MPANQSVSLILKYLLLEHPETKIYTVIHQSCIEAAVHIFNFYMNVSNPIYFNYIDSII